VPKLLNADGGEPENKEIAPEAVRTYDVDLKAASRAYSFRKILEGL
jgi:hypothetical protein